MGKNLVGRIEYATTQFEDHGIEYELKNESTGHFHCWRKSDGKLFQFYAGTGKIVGCESGNGIHTLIDILLAGNKLPEKENHDTPSETESEKILSKEDLKIYLNVVDDYVAITLYGVLGIADKYGVDHNDAVNHFSNVLNALMGMSDFNKWCV